MKKRSTSSIILEVLLGIYAFGYLTMFIIPLFTTDASGYEASLVELITVPLAFVVFLIGFAFCWYDEKIAGIILLIWHFMVWTLALFAWEQAGMVLLLVFPVLILGVLLIQNWYIHYDKAFRDVSKQWKLVLQIMLINYAALYFLVILSGVFEPPVWWNFMTDPAVILIVALTIFLIGFALTWNKEMIAGILLIIWYGIVLFTSINYVEFASSGPASLFGITILIHGVLYIVYHLKFKSYHEGKHVI